MTYKFEKYSYFDEIDKLHKSTSRILIENHEDYGDHFTTEITNLNFDYLTEIVTALEKIISGDLQEYDFGNQVYIECKKSTSVIFELFDYWKIIAEVPTIELYELLRDWKDYLNKNPTIIIEPLNSKKYFDTAENKLLDYIFFDGVKYHQFTGNYEDWLSSSDFSILNNSYVKSRDKLIYLFKENLKVLSTFRYYSKEELELAALQYHLKVREENGIYYAFK